MNWWQQLSLSLNAAEPEVRLTSNAIYEVSLTSLAIYKVSLTSLAKDKLLTSCLADFAS